MSQESADTQIVTSLIRVLKLDASDTEGAVVFLNGPWGSGKTHFWKTELQPALNDCKPIYLSLFGVQNVADLKEKLVAAMIAGGENESFLASARKRLAKFGPAATSAFLSWGGVQFKLDLLELINAKYVICFDDLERLPATASIEEILGFINYLSEHKGYRCLIILNEGEVKETHQQEFKRLREKLSLRTYQLPCNLNARYSAFLTAKAKAFNVTIHAGEAALIRAAVDRAKLDNLRTLRFILDCYFLLRASFGRELPELAIQFLVAIVTYESKGNPKPSEFYRFNSVAIAYRLHAEKDKPKDEQDDVEDVAKFYLEYFGENAAYVAYECILDVVKKGTFDDTSAIRELFPEDAKLTESESLAEEINHAHFYFYDDNDLKDLQAKVLSLLKEDKKITFTVVTSFAKGLTSIQRLLELPEPTALPAGFEEAATESIKSVDEPHRFSTGLRLLDNYSELYLKAFQRIIKAEMARRKNEELAAAIAKGTTKEVRTEIMDSREVAATAFSSGHFERAWNSTALTKIDRYIVLETLVKGMQRYSSDSEVKNELTKTHEFLMDNYSKTTDKMGRLRLYNLIKYCGITLPTDKPKAIKE